MKLFMNMMEADQLTRIYNTLLLVHTSGKDTKMMSQCLEAFETFFAQAVITEDKTTEIKEKEE